MLRSDWYSLSNRLSATLLDIQTPIADCFGRRYLLVRCLCGQSLTRQCRLPVIRTSKMFVTGMSHTSLATCFYRSLSADYSNEWYYMMWYDNSTIVAWNKNLPIQKITKKVSWPSRLLLSVCSFSGFTVLHFEIFSTVNYLIMSTDHQNFLSW